MSQYHGIKFKGYVKPEFRNTFEKIALDGDWDLVEDEVFKKFNENNECAYRIPVANEDEFIFEAMNKYGGLDDFHLTWNKDTGYWEFQCSGNYLGDLWDNFCALIPYFIEKVEYLEYYNEVCYHTDLYTLKDNEVVYIGKKGYDD